MSEEKEKEIPKNEIRKVKIKENEKKREDKIKVKRKED